MEKGLVRALKLLKKKKFKIGTLVTDRHMQRLQSGSDWMQPTLTIDMTFGMLQNVRNTF